MDEYEDVKTAAARLGRSERLVRRWLKEKKLEGVKFSRDWLVLRNAEPTLKWRRKDTQAGKIKGNG